MNTNPIQERWPEIRDLIHTKWTKMSARDINGLNRSLDALVDKICKTYGCTRERAERDYHEFRVSIGPILHPGRR